MRTQNLQKRVDALETRQTSSGAPGDRWPPWDCDPNRRLSRYSSYFDGRPWECTGTPERKGQRDAKLSSYKKYFDQLEAGVAAPE
jgi:hypothetical protein